MIRPAFLPRPRTKAQTVGPIRAGHVSPAGLGFQRLLQIGVATLVALGAMLLGMGQRSMALALLTVSAAVVSIYVTDIRGWVRLNRTVANVAGLIAVSASVANFFHATSEEQLLAVANLLVYLQVVLLFQVKTVRMYWQLLVLSVLQVVVGAALNLDVLFGVLLVAYLFVALAAIGLLFIASEAQRWHKIALRLEEAADEAARPAVRAISPAIAPARPAGPAIQVRLLLSDNLPQQLLGRGILWRTLSTGLGTLVVAAVCFFSMPRFGKALWAPEGQKATVGYSPMVKLGDLGPLLQNPELVMRVDFQDERSGEPINPSDVLLRGSLLTHYQRGEWRHIHVDHPMVRSLRSAPQGSALVRERITIEPQVEPVLFCIYPIYEINAQQPNRHLQFDVDRQQLTRTTDVQAEKFAFELLTTGIVDRRQSRIVPQSSRLMRRQLDELLEMPDAPTEGKSAESGNTVEAADRLTGLRAFAAQKIEQAGLAADDRYGKARLLEKLLSSSPFEYSLNRPPAAEGVDPIEDFVVRNQRGHCEYFASALALMLRSQNIPARIVLGFRGGEWNSLGSFYDVRQLHAHAWVEAFLEPDQIPQGELPPGPPPSHGAWLVLDATPLVSIGGTFGEGSLLSSVADLADYVQLLWNTYVIGLNADRQNQVVYKPLTKFGHALEGLWKHPQEFFKSAAAEIHHWFEHDENAPAGGWRWRVAAIVVLALVCFLFRRSLRRAIRWIWNKRRNDAATAAESARQIDFYRRFERLLARRGLVRRPSQTQLEFARAVERHLSDSPRAAKGELPGVPSTAVLVRRLIDSFYRVRFGHAALDSRQAEAVEQVLGQLEQVVGAGR
jgi:transglutaminase-like putative cysteine protease